MSHHPEEMRLTRRRFATEDPGELSLNIAIPHIRLVYRSRRENMNRIAELIRQSKEENNTHIFLIPSGFAGGPVLDIQGASPSVLKKVSDRIPGQVTSELSELARRFGVYIVTGGFFERAGPRVFVSSVVVSPFQEGVVYRYRKMCLGENEVSVIASGREPGLVEIGGLRIGLLVEEDLFVPEIARVLTLDRSDLIISFSKLNKRFAEVVKSIVVTRAIENSVPVINVGGILSMGGDEVVNVKTLIVKSSGEIEGESQDQEEVFYMTIRIRDPRKRVGRKAPNTEIMRNLIRYMRKNKLLS